tara:strand:+ start:1115 stop:1384 length:270 start_codon:yes stop_codon:yes gene_type:complete
LIWNIKLFFVYLLISKKKNKVRSYVGYTNNLNKRILDHNRNKGAKSTRGRFWRIAYKKKFKNRSRALKYEYSLKKNRLLREKIKKNYVW